MRGPAPPAAAVRPFPSSGVPPTDSPYNQRRHRLGASTMPIRRLTACSLGLAAFALALGATAARGASPFGGSRPDVVDVAVRELPAEDAWQASWRLPGRAAGVDFVHG